MILRFGFVMCLALLLLQACQNTKPNAASLLNETDALENASNDTASIGADQGRAIWQKPTVVLQKLGNLSDKVVCDLGAGGGYFTFKLALKSKKVIAVDIDSLALQYIDSLKTSFPPPFRERIETRHATPTDAKLLPEEVDIILIINTIAYISDLKDYLSRLKQSLKPGGQVMIIDYKMKRLPIQASEKNLRIYADVLEELLYQSTYREVHVDDTSLEYQYIITAKP